MHPPIFEANHSCVKKSKEGGARYYYSWDCPLFMKFDINNDEILLRGKLRNHSPLARLMRGFSFSLLSIFSSLSNKNTFGVGRLSQLSTTVSTIDDQATKRKAVSTYEYILHTIGNSFRLTITNTNTLWGEGDRHHKAARDLHRKIQMMMNYYRLNTKKEKKKRTSYQCHCQP